MTPRRLVPPLVAALAALFLTLGFASPAHAATFDQKVAAREQAHDDPLEHVVLSDDDALHLVEEATHLGLSLGRGDLVHLVLL